MFRFCPLVQAWRRSARSRRWCAWAGDGERQSIARILPCGRQQVGRLQNRGTPRTVVSLLVSCTRNLRRVHSKKKAHTHTHTQVLAKMASCDTGAAYGQHATHSQATQTTKTSKQASKQAGRQAGKQASNQTNSNIHRHMRKAHRQTREHISLSLSLSLAIYLYVYVCMDTCI